MTKKRSVEADTDNPLWTREDFQRAKRRDELTPELEALLPRRRGPQAQTTKIPVTIRLSADVVEALKATGAGWQTRADEMLRKAVKSKPAA
jgi:uncharacterized protein (DUF4415 family)